VTNGRKVKSKLTMRKFKFFQKPVKGDLTMLDGQTILTMSYDDNFIITGGVGSPSIGHDTPEDYYGMRRLYHTNPAEYERQRQIREELRTRLRGGGFTEEERIRYRNDAHQRMQRIERNGFSVPTPKLKWYQRFYNELVDDEKPHKLILVLLTILGGITVLVHHYTQG
jgi:hypothetical protein